MNIRHLKSIKGFTIVEMMVVVVIIAIIASISVFSFVGWKQGLVQRQAQSDLRQASVAMENAKNFGNGYPSGLPATFKGSNSGVTVTYIGGNASAYCLQAVGTAFSTIIYSIDSTVSKDPMAGACGSAFALSAPSPTVSSTTVASVTVTWPAVTGATSYVVKYGTVSPTTTASCTSSPCVINGLSSSTTYKVNVTATSPYNSATSATINATTSAPLPYSQIALGDIGACAKMSDGTVRCWGNNQFGQNGDGTNNNSSVPVQVSLNGKLAQTLYAGYYTTCIIATNLNAYCWGYGDNGELGNGVAASSNTPVQVNMSGALMGKTVKGLYPSGSRNCAIANDNNAYCWGWNQWGGLGNGTYTDSLLPAAVSTSGVLAGKTIKSMSTGRAGHHCAIASDDKAYCWGSNGKGQLGNNTVTTSNVPVAVYTGGVLAGKLIKFVGTGDSTTDSYTCALATDNNVYCWGYNNWGQLGNNSTTDSSVPVAIYMSGVLAGKTIKSLATSALGACVIASDDNAYCWGFNGRSQLGNGSAVTYSAVPVAVTTTGVLAGKTIKSISAGSNHYCVIASDDQAYCWGRGDWGQLGNGTTVDSSTPVSVQ